MKSLIYLFMWSLLTVYIIYSLHKAQRRSECWKTSISRSKRVPTATNERYCAIIPRERFFLTSRCYLHLLAAYDTIALYASYR